MRIFGSRHGAQQLYLLTGSLLILGLTGTFARTIIHLGDRLASRFVAFCIGSTARIVFIVVSCRLEAAEAIGKEAAKVGQCALTVLGTSVAVHFVHLP